MGNVSYYCFKCKKWFQIKKYVAKEIEKYDKKAFCTRCGHNNTNQNKKIITKGSLSDPPSMAQIQYIRGLGGNPNLVSNKREVNEYINKLKKEQSHQNSKNSHELEGVGR